MGHVVRHRLIEMSWFNTYKIVISQSHWPNSLWLIITLRVVIWEQVGGREPSSCSPLWVLTQKAELFPLSVSSSAFACLPWHCRLRHSVSEAPLPLYINQRLAALHWESSTTLTFHQLMKCTMRLLCCFSLKHNKMVLEHPSRFCS